MGSHLNHMIFTLPDLPRGRARRVRVVDGALAGRRRHARRRSTRDIYSEGLQLPIVKIFKRGEQDDELTAIIRTNVRIPELAMGDFRAQIAAIRTGRAARTRAASSDTARPRSRPASPSIYDQSERPRAARLSRAIPDGTYEAESFMDDDGVGTEPVPIKVRVVVAGDEMTIDSARSARRCGLLQLGRDRGPVGGAGGLQVRDDADTYCRSTTARSAPLTIVLPPGRVVSARQARRDALVDDDPDDRRRHDLPRARAGHPGARRRRAPRRLVLGDFTASTRATGGSSSPPSACPAAGGARSTTRDGMNATVCINDGDTHNSPHRGDRGEDPDRGRALRAAPRLGRRRPCIAAVSASSSPHARARRRCDNVFTGWSARSARRGD